MLKSLEIRGERNWLEFGNDSVSLAAALLLAGSLLTSQSSAQERQDGLVAGSPGPGHDMEGLDHRGPWYPRTPTGSLQEIAAGPDGEQDDSAGGSGTHTGGKFYQEMKKQAVRRSLGPSRRKQMLTANRIGPRYAENLLDDQMTLEELESIHHSSDFKRGPSVQRLRQRFRAERRTDLEETPEEIPQTIQPDFSQPNLAIEEYPVPQSFNPSGNPYPRLYVYIPPNPNPPSINSPMLSYNQLQPSVHPKIL